MNIDRCHIPHNQKQFILKFNKKGQFPVKYIIQLMNIKETLKFISFQLFQNSNKLG